MASLVSGTTGISRMTWRRVRPVVPLPPRPRATLRKMHEAGDIFGVGNADDVLGAVGGFVDGDAGVLLFDDAGAGLFDGEVGGEGEDFAARGHDLADGDVVEFDGSVDDLLLKDGEKAHAAGGGGDEFEFFRGVDRAFAAEGRAEEFEDDACGVVQQIHDGAGDADEDVHGAGDGEGDAFCSLEGEGLRDEFAEEDFEVSDEREGDDDGDGVCVNDCMRREDVEPRFGEVEDGVGYRGFADPAEGEPGYGDSELDGGEELVDGVLELESGAGAGAPKSDELLDTGFADADQREFGRDEETAGQDEEGHQDHAEEKPLEHECKCNGCGGAWPTMLERSRSAPGRLCLLL